MGRTLGRLRAPIAVAMASVMLVVMVDAGMRLPGTGMVDSVLDSSLLDYSAPPFGRFKPLRGPFVSSVLGPFVRDPASAAPLGRPQPAPADEAGPLDVTHGLTNDAAGKAYRVLRVPFTARTDTAGARREPDDPSDCATLGQKTVWYEYTPFSTGGIVATTATDEPIYLGVYTGEITSSSRALGCDSDPRGRARVPLTVIAGTTYLFQISVNVGGTLVFSLDRAATTSAVSLTPDGNLAGAPWHWGYPKISANGRYVAFLSSSPHLDPRCKPAGDVTPPCSQQAYVRDLATGRVEMVSLTDAGGIPNSEAITPAISANGRYVAWATQATDVLPGDEGTEFDVYLRDRRRGRTERVTVERDGTELNGGQPVLSANGRYVAWQGDWEQRSAGPAGPHLIADVYWQDRVTGETMLVSVSNDGRRGNNHSSSAAMSPDGRFVTFMSKATALASGPGHIDGALNLLGIDQHHVYTYDTKLKRLSLECVAQDGTPANDQCWGHSISSGGRFSTFWSSATNLVDDLPLPTGASQFIYCYRRDRSTGRLEVVNVTDDGQVVGEAWQRNVPPYVEWKRHATSAISWDGSIVAFETDLSLVAGDENGFVDSYVRDLERGRTIRLSESSSGVEGNQLSQWTQLSEDGTIAVFHSLADNFVPGDTNGTYDIFARAWRA